MRPTYIIIVGLGGIGKSLVELAVKGKNDVVVIDGKEARCHELTKKYDVLTIIGNATEEEILEEAGASRANALVATTSDDAANLMVCLAAREKGTKKVISVVNHREHIEMFKKEDISMLSNPDMTIARHLYASAKNHRGIKDCFDISGGKAEIFEVVVPNNSNVAGKRLSELNLKKGVIVAIVRNNEVILPKSDTLIQAGDSVTIFAKPEDVERVTDLFA